MVVCYTQVVSALGAVAGRQPDGSFGYLDGMSPERVEAQGKAGLSAAAFECIYHNHQYGFTLQ